MTRRTFLALSALAAAALLAGSPVTGAVPSATLTLINGLDAARLAETIVLRAGDLKPVFGTADLRTVYVRDERGADILAQAVDVDDDDRFDELVFQVDLAAGQTRTLTLVVGDRRIYARDQFRAYGRFVRERRDDFAWENDRTAHRMYGVALETWAKEPLTSSAVDVWLKRTPKLVIDDWYLVDDYHRDHGDGADFYSAGKSRGCGGSGLWEAGRLWTSQNFRDSKVFANGPIRVSFELTYAAWDVNGRPVRERKRITLDAGQQLSRFDSVYRAEGALPTQFATGIKKGPATVITADVAAGLLQSWEPVPQNGSFGCGIVMAPAAAVGEAEGGQSGLLVGSVGTDGSASYYAGAAWDRGGHIADAAQWNVYLRQFARRLASPVTVRVTAR